MLLVIPRLDKSVSDTNEEHIGACHQAPVRVPSRMLTGYVIVTESVQTTDHWIWLCLIGAICTVICNWVVCNSLNRDYPAPLRTNQSKVPIAHTRNVWSNWRLIHISPIGWKDSGILIIGSENISHTSLHIFWCHGCVILTTPHCLRNEPFDHW